MILRCKSDKTNGESFISDFHLLLINGLLQFMLPLLIVRTGINLHRKVRCIIELAHSTHSHFAY